MPAWRFSRYYSFFLGYKFHEKAELIKMTLSLSSTNMRMDVHSLAEMTNLSIFILLPYH